VAPADTGRPLAPALMPSVAEVLSASGQARPSM
jgi:hypothetical protein